MHFGQNKYKREYFEQFFATKEELKVPSSKNKYKNDIAFKLYIYR